MAMSNYLESQMSNFLFKSNSNNFVTPDSIYLALYKSDPTDSDVGDEVSSSGTGYERQLLSINDAVNGLSTNNIQINFSEANIGFFYNDVHSISFSFSGQIDLSYGESIDIMTALYDSLGNPVERNYEVWFKMLNNLEGTNINNILFGTEYSLAIQTDDGIAVATLNAGNPVPTTDDQIARAYVRYLLIDGPDMLIAKRLLAQNIPISAENIQWYKQNLIRMRLRADLGMEEVLQERLGDKERRLI